jgi:hypothetical protein
MCKLTLSLLEGTPALLAAHRDELPQRDDLCGAFCAALGLRAAGLCEHAGEAIDQDAVALAAGSLISARGDHGSLPAGETGRRDYRLALPLIEDSSRSGTTPAGLARAVRDLSGGALQALPLAGPWSAAALAAIFDAALVLERPVTLVANIATRHLWGTHPRADELLAYLLEGRQDGPPPDWDVGHFVCVIARVEGPGGSLYVIADTYPSLGTAGVYAQPAERLALALQRPAAGQRSGAEQSAPAGGILALAAPREAEALRGAARAAALHEAPWDNGTLTAPLAA